VAALEPGLVGEVTREVTPDISAHSMGNEGVHVLGTPALLMLIEQAAIRAIEPTFAEGQSSVGTLLNVRHLAATPVGMSVMARARLVQIDGRRLTYEVEAHDDREQVASGTHERFLVDMARFLARVEEKARG
jgi:fluoroacetyl-CoA thioesterase